MAETATKFLSDKTSQWTSVNFYLRLLKYTICFILKIVFFVAAYVTRRFSSLFEWLYEKIKISEKEDKAEKSIENRFVNNSSMSHNIKSEEQKEVNEVIFDSVNESNHNDYNDSFVSYNYTNEDQKNVLEVISDKVNKSSLHIEFNGISSTSHNNTNEEQIEVDEVISDSANETTLHTEFKDTSSISHDNRNEDQVEVDEVIFDTANESLHTEAESITCIEKSEHKPKTNDEIYEYSINFTPKCQVNQEKTHDPKITAVDVEPLKVERKRVHKSPAMRLITKTLKENVELQKKKELESKSNMDRRLNRAINDGSPRQDRERSFINNADNFRREKKLSKPDLEKNDYSKLSNNSSRDISYSSTNYKNDSYENRKSMNIFEDQDTQINREYCDKRKSSYENEKLMELNVDIFNLHPEFSIALCITEDLQFVMGISTDLKNKFGRYGELMDQNLLMGDVGEILYNEQYVFYLVVKKKIGLKLSNLYLEKALNNLLCKMNMHKLTKLVIPTCGSNYIELSEEKEIISNVFIGSDVKVTTTVIPKSNTRHGAPKINTTPKQLWEIEPQTDLIMFIDMEQMYLDNWKDEVVENINTRYPFKNKLLKDIHIKPMAPGDVLSYKINHELLFCVFIKPINQNPSYYKCLEKAFKEIQSQVTGYRYLGIQEDSVNQCSSFDTMSRHLLLLQLVFDYLSAEIWICGDSNHHKSNQYTQYKKMVHATIEGNKKVNSRTNGRTKFKHERRRNTVNGAWEERNYKNKSYDSAVYSVGQETVRDRNDVAESWD